MRAMILAAGRGERVRPLSDRIPKPLFPVNGRPLIAWSLGLLKDVGITEVIVNTHHLGPQIEAALATCGDLGMDITFSRESRALETGGGIAQARDFLYGGTFVVVNADVICDVDIAAVVSQHRKTQALATMVIRENPEPARIPVVEWEPNTSRVLDIRGDIGRASESSRQMMFTGIHVIDPVVFDYLLPRRESVIDGFYLPILREGRTVSGYMSDGYWADLGTLETYQRVCDEIDGVNLGHSPLELKPAL
jgi:NDP-sugar pyrophosphorylase family protein